MLAMNSVEEFREQLREWREDGGRHSDEVWEEVITKKLPLVLYLRENRIIWGGGNLNSEKKELLGSLSFQVVQFWDEGLETAIDDLGEERWMVLEQVRPEFRQLKNFCSFLKWLFTFPTIVDTITPHTWFFASDDL